MTRIASSVEHQLRGLESESAEAPTPLGFVIDLLVLIVPALVVVLGAALTVYFFA
jgi:hypothetical protein